jgi:hypothetical protein
MPLPRRRGWRSGRAQPLHSSVHTARASRPALTQASTRWRQPVVGRCKSDLYIPRAMLCSMCFSSDMSSIGHTSLVSGPLRYEARGWMLAFVSASSGPWCRNHLSPPPYLEWQVAATERWCTMGFCTYDEPPRHPPFHTPKNFTTQSRHIDVKHELCEPQFGFLQSPQESKE